MRMNPHRITREIDQAAHRPDSIEKRSPDILAFAHKRKLRRLHRAQIGFGAAADDFGHIVFLDFFISIGMSSKACKKLESVRALKQVFKGLSPLPSNGALSCTSPSDAVIVARPSESSNSTVA